MQKLQVRLTIGLLFSALAVLAFFGTTVVSGSIDFLYRNAAGLTTARSAAQALTLLALVALFAAGLMIAIPTALQAGNWLRKVLYVLPVYLLGFTLVGIVSTSLLGVGTVGNFFNLRGVGSITLGTAWLAVGSVLSVITVAIAVARAKLSASTARAALMTTGIASVLSLVAALAVIVSVAIVATSTPASGFGGDGFPLEGGQGQRQQGQNAPGGQGQSTQEAGGRNGASNGNGQFPQGGGAQQGGGFSGGGSGNSVTSYEIGSALMLIFALIGVCGAIAALRGTPTMTPTQAAGARNLPREAGMAILSGVGVTVVAGRADAASARVAHQSAGAIDCHLGFGANAGFGDTGVHELSQ